MPPKISAGAIQRRLAKGSAPKSHGKNGKTFPPNKMMAGKPQSQSTKNPLNDNDADDM